MGGCEGVSDILTCKLFGIAEESGGSRPVFTLGLGFAAGFAGVRAGAGRCFSACLARPKIRILVSPMHWVRPGNSIKGAQEKAMTAMIALVRIGKSTKEWARRTNGTIVAARIKDQSSLLVPRAGALRQISTERRTSQ